MNPISWLVGKVRMNQQGKTLADKGLIAKERLQRLLESQGAVFDFTLTPDETALWNEVDARTQGFTRRVSHGQIEELAYDVAAKYLALYMVRQPTRQHRNQLDTTSPDGTVTIEHHLDINVQGAHDTVIINRELLAVLTVVRKK